MGAFCLLYYLPLPAAFKAYSRKQGPMSQQRVERTLEALLSARQQPHAPIGRASEDLPDFFTFQDFEAILRLHTTCLTPD